MADSVHFGIIQDNVVYTTKALARIILEKEELATDPAGTRRIREADVETINKHLRELRCPATPIGRTVYVSGLHFRLAVEAGASLGWLAPKTKGKH